MEIIKHDDHRGVKFAKRIIVVSLSAIVMAFNIQSFVHTGGLFPGGINGLTLLLQRVGDEYFGTQIPYTLLYVPLNLIPIFVGVKYVGRNFTVFSLYQIVLTSILTDLIPEIAITYDELLVGIFGGMVNGFSITLCLFVGASSGGMDFVSVYLSERRGLDSWNFILAGNICVLVAAGLLFGFDKALYSIIFQFSSTQVIHNLYRRYTKHTLLVITELPDAVYARIKEITRHDATLFKGTGMYERHERSMVYSVIAGDELGKVMRAIKSVDPRAFVNVVRTEQVDGTFYKRPME